MVTISTLLFSLHNAALAGPDACVDIDGTVTCSGDQSSGIDYSGTGSLNINNLTKEILPAPGVSGIYYGNTSGENVIINSGTSEETIVIKTTDENATGISGKAQGTPSGAAEDDPFLGVPDIGANDSIPGGYVEISSYSDITTDGGEAHGIYGYSASRGYSQTVINKLKSFTEEGFTFEVIEVRTPDGDLAVFTDDKVTVKGYLFDDAGNPLTDNEGNIIEHGTFVIGRDGTYEVSYSGDEIDQHNDLETGESLIIGLNYTVKGERATNIREDDAFLFAVIEKNETGVIEENYFAKFDTFGLSTKPEGEANIFPDLEWYVSNMLAEATAGGSGGTVTINSDGTVETLGEESHGIHAYSIGGKGTPGKDSTFYLVWESKPTPGGDGKSPGSINVNADGVIITHQDESNGISAVSAGGAGGAGGDGVAYRDGRRGGTGGDGGTVELTGSAIIETEGDYSSGILALSVGGDGGAGGSSGGIMSGGNGGYGGKGGEVTVVGDWNITTGGNMAHGIWAKSLGGNAGDGGSGGWGGAGGTGGKATDGGTVTLVSGGEITTSGESSFGLHAQSVGGFGGDGGSSWGLFWSFGGNAESGGSGGDVNVINNATGKVTTGNDYSHAILAQSVGGGGGNGGGSYSLIALGGEGASGGNGGEVTVENNGWLETFGTGAHGIFAQSIGGGGGDGGSTGGLLAIGGSGSEASDGGDVTVINRGTITTHGMNSHAVFAESVGGGGGNGGRSGGLISIGGSGDGGGDAGTVTIQNEGELHTLKDESYGIFAQSIGGGGGSGGGAVSGGLVSIGGKGAGGGDADNVTVYNNDTGSITTEGNRSYGIFAQSVGGGGGDGGFAITAGAGVSVAVGGDAGPGGDGGIVDVTTEGGITTYGTEAYGIFAQSIGGGGGTGGFAVAGSYGGIGLSVNLGLGGDGGRGGMGDTVNVNVGGLITTSGLRAHGVLAQSIGGSGGDGGFAVAGSIGSGTSVNLAFGGDGGAGNNGGDVNVAGSGNITTEQDEAHGIFAQSVGGSGGSGGFSVAASLGGGASLELALGGDGGNASSAGTVTVGSETNYLEGAITTHGDRAYGILAQSVGGGGGAGGAAISGALLGSVSIGLGFGGDGGVGGLGGMVDIYNDSTISTHGSQSYGILAQSIGGGGGTGGLSITGSVTAFGGLAFSMGGDGGSGNNAGEVTVFNTGSIDTEGEYSYGILAQSVGGGGGAGGSSGSVMVNFSSLIPIPEEYPTGSVNISASLGGNGGEAGDASRVEVENAGEILTTGDHAYGIFAQSVGGGGGDGGKSTAVTANISAPSEMDKQIEVQVDFAMAIGGDGKGGGAGSEVEIINSGLIDTSGIGAHGIFAQSVGGGGGSGADARSMILSIDPSNWSESDPPPDPTSISVGATLSIGGKGGVAGDGGTVNVKNEKTIITRGADAFGILAQSVGGGGGSGGSGYHGLDLEDFGVPEEYAQFQDILPVQDEGDLHITVGGSSGAGGDGKDVGIENIGDIFTYGHGALGVLAQSIGGGGGLAGIGATGGDGSVSLGGGGGDGGNGGNIDIGITGGIYTEGIGAHGIFAQSVGGGGGYAGNVDRGVTDLGINVAMGGGGGDGGNGGDISINSEGVITTKGDGAIGIFAQSVGGGGGLGGEVGFGFGFAGSVGGEGDGGTVNVVHTGNITTYGQYAHGIFAQSVGGADYGGNVSVRVSGDITVHGEGSLAVIAQSEGTAGKRDINVTYEGGTITGGSAPAVTLLDGDSNTFTNYGAVTTFGGIDGTAVSAEAGNDTVYNHGKIIGSVDLGEGFNAIYNFQDGVFESGGIIQLGSGNTLTNLGILSPGGSGTTLTTRLGSNLEQSSSGIFRAEVFANGENDQLLLQDGSVTLDGTLEILTQKAYYFNGTKYSIIKVENGPGISGTFTNVILPEPKPLLRFDVNQYSNYVEVGVDAPSITTVASNRVEYVIADYLNSVIPTASGDLLNVFVEFQHLLSEEFGAAFSSLSPGLFDISTVITYYGIRNYTSTLLKRMHSLQLMSAHIDPQEKRAFRERKNLLAYNGSTASIRQLYTPAHQKQAQYGVWLDGFGQWGDQDEEEGFPSYDYSVHGLTVGFDHMFRDNYLAGISLGFSNTDIEIDGNQGEGDIDSVYGSLYGSYYTRWGYIDAALSYGNQDYWNKRQIIIGPIVRETRSDHDGDMLSAFIEAGYNKDFRTWGLQPFASLHYINLDEEGFTEKGADSINLVIGQRGTESLVSELGFRIFSLNKLESGTLLPELSLAWSYDFDIDDRVITAAFAGAPDSGFSLAGQPVANSGAKVGAGITLMNTNGLITYLKYSGEFRDGYRAHSINGELRYEF